MIVARRKPRQKKTNSIATSRDHVNWGLGQTDYGLRQVPKGNSWDWSSINKGGEASGPLNVGREPLFGLKKVDQHTDIRSSPSVKGKKDLVRSRASKWMSKLDSEGVRKIVPNVTSVWTSLGKEGVGECSDEGFQFAARGRSEVGLQSRQQNCGEAGGGSASSRDGLGRQVGDASVERVLPGDGNQCKGGGSSTNSSEVQRKSSGDKDVLVLLEDHTCDQAYTRAQNTYQGEGAGYGSVGAADEDGMDGVEVEEGRGEFGSSV